VPVDHAIVGIVNDTHLDAKPPRDAATAGGSR